MAISVGNVTVDNIVFSNNRIIGSYHGYTTMTLYSLEWRDDEGKWHSQMTYPTKKSLMMGWANTVRASMKEGGWHLPALWRASKYKIESSVMLTKE